MGSDPCGRQERSGAGEDERFQRFLAAHPKDKEAWDNADAEEKQKDPKAAKEAYAKYLDLSPDAKNAPEIRKKVEKIK